jgi:hypothetical protein
MIVVALPDASSDDSDSCAEIFRELLERAERGEIQACAVAYVAKGHEVGSAIEVGSSFNALLGATTLLQHDVLHHGDVPGIDG